MSKLVDSNPAYLPPGHFTVTGFEALEGARPISELPKLMERHAFMSAMATLKKKSPHAFATLLSAHRAKSWSDIPAAAYAKVIEQCQIKIGAKALTEIPVRDALAILADKVYGR